MKHLILRIGAVLALALTLALPALARQEVVIGIGTQNTTTNTVTGGVVLKEMKLIE
jgi:NitT/TauT family transport system substrate-binding protein